jgi:hypothetical protein
MGEGLKLGGVFTAECYDKHGRKKWEDKFHNVVVNVGVQHTLDVLFAGGTQVNPWYMGLLATTDILSTHTSTDISEATECSDAQRPTFVDGRTANTVDNSSGKSTFNIDADGTTVEGAFLISSEDFGSTEGILLSGGVFSGGTKVGDSGDKIIVTYTFVGSDDTSS